MVLVTLLLLLGSLVILYPFLDSIVIAVLVSYLLKAAHTKLNIYLDNELLSSAIIIASVVVGISTLLYLFINNFFTILTQFNAFAGSLREGVLRIVDFLNLSEQFQQNLESFLNTLSNRVTDEMISTFTSIPSLLIDVGIFLVTAIFLYKDREKLESQMRGLIDSIPEPERRIVRSLVSSIDDIFRGVFMTQFTVAFIIMLVSGIGLYAIQQLTSYIPFIPLWSVLMGIAALIPLFAAFMVYGPIGLYYLMVGQPFKGSLILIFGAVVINILTEIFLRPYVGSRQMDEHPLVIFLGFLTGPLVLGIKGIILGPLLLILTKEFALNYANVTSVESSHDRNEGKAS